MTETYRDRIYGGYVHSRHQSLAPNTLADLESRGPYLRKLIREHFPADQKTEILDVGCGHGAVLHFAHAAGYRNARGVDGSAEQVVEAKRLGISGVEQGDLLAYLRATASASIDVVIAIDVLEHFDRNEMLPFIDEVHRVLVPGGRWIIHVPNGDSPFCGMMRYHDFTHELAFTRASINQVLRSSGFARVDCYEDAPVPHGLLSGGRWLLWKFIRAVLRFMLTVETGTGPKTVMLSQNFLAVAVKE
jgi:SAM-dependent methyltransferase